MDQSLQVFTQCRGLREYDLPFVRFELAICVHGRLAGETAATPSIPKGVCAVIHLPEGHHVRSLYILQLCLRI
jgi:hypothetical protein